MFDPTMFYNNVVFFQQAMFDYGSAMGDKHVDYVAVALEKKRVRLCQTESQHSLTYLAQHWLVV